MLQLYVAIITYVELLCAIQQDKIKKSMCHRSAKKAKGWVKSFTSLKSKCDGYQPENVTPYMHIMALHMPEVIRKHNNLLRFSCQGTDYYVQ